jgi:HSP20 family protein
MVDTANKVPVKAGEGSPVPAGTAWLPFEGLRREVDRLFEDFGDGWFKPLSRQPFSIAPAFGRRFEWKVPAVDIVENNGAFEITAEVPGLDANGLEVTVRNGNLVIKGEKQDEKDEESKDYHLHERHFGSFERAFAIPDGVDADRIEASFNKGILKVTLPKTADAQKPEKKITVKAS